MRTRTLVIALLMPLGLFGCASLETHELLQGTLWVQTAPEYKAAVAQTYASAHHSLEAALADPSWTAVLEQGTSGFEELPPAIIVDVDETVLDNSPYQAYMAVHEEEFSEDSWHGWVREEAAEALPGAVEFLDKAAEAGVTIFYVTNRAVEVEEATRANLEATGFPHAETSETVMLKGENGWESDKTSRRAHVAENYRVILLFGDDLNDFTSGVRTEDPQTRREVEAEHREMWGRKWFVLPNPLYGSWDASLFGRDHGLSRGEKLKRKYGHLEPHRSRP